MHRVVHFEIHAEQPGRARSFYIDLFGWEFTPYGPVDANGEAGYWLVKTGPDSEPGINGGLTKRRGPINGDAVIAYVCTIDVVSLDEAVSKVVTLGGENVVPKMAIPGIGWLAYCKDTEANLFGLIQPDPAAA